MPALGSVYGFGHGVCGAANSTRKGAMNLVGMRERS